MKKKLIGYKLAKTDYSSAALNIIGISKWNTNHYENFAVGSNAEERVKKAGVLDLWFEPVYANSTPDITIKGYKAEFTKTSVKFGCQIYTKDFVLTLAKCLEDNDFEMDIKDEILEIAEYFKS